MAKKKRAAPAGEAKRPTPAEIARLDRKIVELLDQRYELAAAAGDGKRSPGDLVEQEDQQLEALVSRARKRAAPAPYVRSVLREVMAGCRDTATPPSVAYLGPEHTFSHLAALRRFGATANLCAVGSIAAVFEEVDRGNSAFGVVPLENSTDGRVTDTLDCFARTRVHVCGELPLRIHHCLLGKGARSDVRLVCSKPQALSQCRNWLAQHLPHADTRAVASTAEAARLAGDDPATAAIASAQAGRGSGLAVIARNIEDQPDNVTRFAIIGREPAPRTGADKTALMFEVAHEPGALADAMTIFKRKGLNMTWIESFPIPSSGGRYLFFVEFIGHQTDLRARRAIEALGKKAKRLEVLGSYPQTEPID